jgi:hypothetical protein
MDLAPRSARRTATALFIAALAILLAVGSVLASTPVTVGYRDHAYGGGAFRPSGDKPQSKLFYTDGTWFGGMFRYNAAPSPNAEHEIFKLDEGTHSWVPANVTVDARDTSHADYLWDEGSQTLYVASTVPIPLTTPTIATDDGIKIFKYTYNAATNAFTKVGATVTIPNTASVPNVSRGGAKTVTIALDSTGDLWTAWPKGDGVNIESGQVLYSKSDDGGVVWSDPAQVPVQAANPIHDGGQVDANDVVAVIAFGAGSPSNVGIAWSDQSQTGSPNDNGFYFAHIAAGADPTVEANWTLEELPSLVTTGDTEKADDHINMKTTSDGSVYMVGKTGTDTTACATNKNRPLVEFFARTPGGSWGTAHLVGTVGDCNTRPQLVISEQLDTAFVFLTSPNGGGTVYVKSAPLSGSEAYEFRAAADQNIQRGTAFIKSATETLIDDPSTTKQVVTAASGIVVIANNLTATGSTNKRFFLHNEMSIAASDSAAPAGTIAINGGAANTGVQAVTVSVPATDPGSGVSLVRLSNSPTTSGGVLTTGTTFNYATPVGWTLEAGLGTKTVYAQWRDGAGNWSAVSNDTIDVVSDATPPTTPGAPVHAIGGSATYGIPVRLTWTASTDVDSPPVSYEVQQSINGGAFATIATPTTNSLNLALSNTSKVYRFRVRAIDNVNNMSPYATGASFKAISYNEQSSTIAYSGTWYLVSAPTYIGGKAKYATAANARATFSFNGSKVGWLARTGPTSGSARVYVDGVLRATVNLYAPTTGIRKLVYTRSWSTVGNHTLRIVVLGTAGHPRVTIDQFIVLR